MRMRSTAEDSTGERTTETRAGRRSWTTSEDETLCEEVASAKASGQGWSWVQIAERVGKRNGRQCRQRYEQYLSPGIVRREWMEEEDERLRELYEEYGPKWAHLARTFFPGRSSQAVKNRWNYYVGTRGRRVVHRGAVGVQMRVEPYVADQESWERYAFVAVTSESDYAPMSEVEIWTDDEENMVDIFGYGMCM